MHGLYLDGHTLCIGAHDMQRNSCVHVLSDPNHLAPRREEHEAPGVSPHGRNAGIAAICFRLVTYLPRSIFRINSDYA